MNPNIPNTTMPEETTPTVIKKPKSLLKRVPPHPQEVWTRAWCNVAIATACKTPEIATQWDDHAFNAYLKRWPWKRQDDENIKELEVEPIALPVKK